MEGCMTSKDTSGSHGSRPSREGWLVDSAYKALESLEDSIWGEGGGPSNATLYHLNCLRGTLQLLQESPGSSTRVPECEETEISTGSFCQVATSTMRQLGKEALVQGVRIRHEFSPSLRSVEFAPGGAVLLGLVRQALASVPRTELNRCITVSARVDGRSRISIGIEDSARHEPESICIKEFGNWRRRIAVLGGELRLRNIPFGTGTTIEARLPVRMLAA